MRELEEHRAALTGHCYRMLGSAAEADDAVQDTMVRAWRSLDRFEGRAALRTWLYRIATRVCLDRIGDRRRVRSMELGPAGRPDAALTALPASTWLEPIADVTAIPADADPAEAAILRQSLRLAFVAALQHLPARQRAALLLAEVLGWPVAEIAESLDLTVAAVNSALQRARATLASRDVHQPRGELTASQRQLVDRFVDAFTRYDMDELSSLLAADAALSMPPYSLWLAGPADITAFMLGTGGACRGSRLVAVAACGSPAFVQYKPGADAPWALVVVEVAGDRIAGLTYFLDTEPIVPRLGARASV